MKKKVIIVGGGFGGINAARSLANQPDVEVLLIDQRNHHLFQPLLYQVAMAGLSPAEIAAPIRNLVSEDQNIEVLLGKVLDVKVDSKILVTDFGELSFDYLILACGAQHSYFGHNEWEEHAPGLKTLEQATEIRRRILVAFELAEREANPAQKQKHLNFVIVGGGPTGVELAGSLAEMTQHSLKHDFKRTDLHNSKIFLIEGTGRVLSAFDPALSLRAAQDLKDLGVTLLLNSRVTQISAEGVKFSSAGGDSEIASSTVIWAAGVKPSALNAKLGAPLDPQGRVKVQPDLSIGTSADIFAIGDQVHFATPRGPLPGQAQVAMQMGVQAAKNILASVRGEARREFKYWDKGQMATIGRKRAVLESGKIKLSGFIAWLGWLVIHIYYLIGFKNRLFVLFQWIWSYFTYKRGARLIVGKDWKSAQN